MARTLSSLIEGGERYVRTYVESNVLYFRIDWGEGPGAWLPVSDSRGHLVQGRRGSTLNRQLLHWDRVVGRAVDGAGNGACDYDVSWGWAILNKQPVAHAWEG